MPPFTISPLSPVGLLLRKGKVAAKSADSRELGKVREKNDTVVYGREGLFLLTLAELESLYMQLANMEGEFQSIREGRHVILKFLNPFNVAYNPTFHQEVMQGSADSLTATDAAK